MEEQVPELGSIGPRDNSMVSDIEHFSDGSPYFGLQQCRGRALHRTVSKPRANQSPVRFVGYTYSVSVLHQAEQQVEAFYSRLPDPLALPGNPLQVDWSQSLLYMYLSSPLPLPSLALHRVIRAEVEVIIAILPWWPRRGWFLLVLQFLVDLPVLLPEINSLSPQSRMRFLTLIYTDSAQPPGDSRESSLWARCFGRGCS